MGFRGRVFLSILEKFYTDAIACNMDTTLSLLSVAACDQALLFLWAILIAAFGLLTVVASCLHILICTGVIKELTPQ